jgi:hypothetical protein
MKKKRRTPAEIQAAKLEAARKLVAAADAALEPAVVENFQPEAATTNRAPRSADTRENTTRRKPWEPPSMLDAPPPPPGYHHRWIRAEMLGEADKINMSKRIREGFEPVRASEYPGFEMPTIEDGKHAGVISVGGLILARIPLETVAERNRYYSNLTNNQLKAIDNELKAQSQAIMPIGTPERTTRTEFGNPDNRSG